MPAAARVTDMHTCPMVDPGPKPHVGGPIISGDMTVLIGFMPAARISDKAICIGPIDTIVQGEPTVLIGNQPASRRGDSTAHGGKIVMGCPTVNIGSSPQAETLKTDEPFCEECERAKKAREAARKNREA